MLSRLLLVGVLAGAGIGGLLGQTSSVPFDWASLVGGAVGSSPAAVVLAWRLSKADKEAVSLRDELRTVNDKTYLMVERMGPVLGEATRTLAEVRAGMEATIDRAKPADLDKVLRQLQTLTSNLERDRRSRDVR